MPRTTLPHRLRFAWAAACLALVGACSDPTSAPTPRLSAELDELGVADGARNDSMFVPNWRKYADSGQRPVVGRAGTAMMATWALLSRDGSAQVEVVAGGWGGWTRSRRMHDPLGGVQLERVQIKAFDAKGEALYTRNFDGTGGPSGTFPANGLMRGGRAQVQGIITGVDFARAGVVTVDAPVLLRPDLTVSSVEAGPRAGVNTTVTVRGVVRELNGELGAWANCALYVDGVPSDSAYGIWVDAGGTATCVFAHSFRSAGTKQLEIRVEEIAPGDYDPSNNAASRPISVLPVLSHFWWVASFEDRTFFNAGEYEQSFTSHDGRYGHEQAVTDTVRARVQQSYLSAYMPYAVRFPLGELVGRQYTALETTHSVRFVNLPADWSWDDGILKQSCVARGYDQPGLGRGWLHVCAYEQRAGGGDSVATGAPMAWTTVQYDRYAGDVAYASRGYARFWNRDLGIEDVYTWNNTSREVVGRFARYTQEYIFLVQLLDAGRRSNLNTVVGLLPFSSSYDNPRSCWSWEDPWGSASGCSASSSTESGVMGVVLGEPYP